ncbi:MULTISPECIES: PAS domain S-box protein [unclassified Pseudoalteromonas]|uniref:PAS domain-containing protein n=1 Tax=unclassified Pseudoalteromonas TaxID=194690 RepID=UPI0020969C80|nr:PAS domain S-box protein [Pseudoalteromonas sp. XMcav2-N]MCO7187814.1 PAS domain S-box protein [Pseudoalteromonas sp. XMcav2-N]
MNTNDPSMEETLFFGQLLENSSPIELLKQVLMRSQHAIVVTDANRDEGYRIVYANRVFCRHTGYELAELVGQSTAILQGPKSNRRVLARLSPALEKNGYFYGSSVNYRKDGSMYPVEWNISAITNEAGEVTHYISLQKDLTNMRRLVRQIRESTDVFKQFYQESARQGSRFGKGADSVLSALKRSAKLLNGRLHLKDNVELFQEAFPYQEPDENSFDELFFDLDEDSDNGADQRLNKQAMTAEAFWTDSPIEEDDVESIVGALNELESETGLIELNGYSEARFKNVARLYKELANTLYFCIEFNDGALMIDEVADRLESQAADSNFPIEFLLMFNKDINSWLNDVFVEKETDNVFGGESNAIMAGEQLLSLIGEN